MGIYPQSNEWQCGPFALKHALLVYGIMATESELSRAAGTSRYGTDDEQLKRAARRYDCDLQMIRRSEPEKARRELVAQLRKRIPCLICIENWNHWVTVLREEKGQFIYLDSQEPEVVVIANWTTLRRLWAYREPDDYDAETIYTFYDLHPLVPRRRVKTRARFSLERARYLRRHTEFARLWDVYVDDLLAICRPRTPQSERVISMGEFLRRHGSMIVDQLDYWHGDLDPKPAERILEHMKIVADTYRLVIHEEDEKRAIASLSILLGMWAAVEFGMDPIYKPEKPKPRRRSHRGST